MAHPSIEATGSPEPVASGGELAPDSEVTVTVTVTATATASAGATLGAIARVQSATADFDDRNEATRVDSAVT
jgi:hypothetical protein